MKRSFIILFAIVCANNSTLAQKAHSKTAQEEIIALEKSFSELVISQDTNQIKSYNQTLTFWLLEFKANL
jgi:hypothetical protein